MQAIAIVPGQPESVHLRDLPRPTLDGVPDGRGVRLRIVRAGLCGTELITDRIDGLDPAAIAAHLGTHHDGIKAVVEVGPSSR